MKDESQKIIIKETAATRKPAEIYHFWNNMTHWGYTSADYKIVYEGRKYFPATIERGGVTFSAELEVSTLDISVAEITRPVRTFLAQAPMDLLWVSVSRPFRDLSPIEVSTVFIGQISNVSFKGLEAKVNCVGFEFFLSQPIPRFRYQPECNHTIYDAGCGVDKTLYSATAVVSAVSANGLELTSDTFDLQDDGYYTLGFLEFGVQKRMITDHEDSVITLRYRIPELVAGSKVTVYAGCDGSVETCRDKFDNVDNHFGMPFIPFDNPTTVA